MTQIAASDFCDELASRGVGFHTGVPCSFFQGPISLLSRREGGYVPAANEGAALALAAGAELAGTRSVVMLQNSGFGNLVNPLTSLAMPYEIPLLVFMSLRGWPDPEGDEPQHAVMGSTSHALLDALGVAHWTLEPDLGSLRAILDEAEKARADRKTAFVLVPKGAVGVDTEPVPAAAAPNPFRRREALAAVAPILGDAIVYATTGYISRELGGLADRPRNFYMQGSMGHAVSLGLGTALARPGERVVVLDGDGAALMHLGALATAGALAPPNLTHVVLDNRAYESTGAQRTTSPAVAWAELGRSLGYRTAVLCDDAQALAAAMAESATAPGPHLITALISADPAAVPPRVSALGAPSELRERFEASFRRHPAV